MTDPHPFSPVWPTGADSPSAQLLYRRYVERSRTDTRLMPPAIAEYAITALTQPRDIVLDPDCGAGTTIVEALRIGRHAIGLTGRPRWWRIARANVTAAKAAGAGPDGMVLVLNRRTTTFAAATTAGLTSRVALLLTSLRGAPTDPDDRLRDLLTESRPLLRPGGHVVITAPRQRHPITGELTDGLHHILTAGTAAGLAPIARCVALTAAVHGRVVTSHPDYDRQCGTALFERAGGHLETLSAHHAVVVFRADPDATDASIPLRLPSLPVVRRRVRRTESTAELAA